MKTMVKSVVAAAAIAAVSTAAIAQSNFNTGYIQGDVTVGEIQGPDGGAALLGGSETVVYVPREDETRVQTVEAVDVTGLSVDAPTEGEVIDMSGADGKLRACYANGGIAKQGDDFLNRCTYEEESVAGPVAQNSDFTVAPEVDTGYDGHANPQDEALIDCLERGGSLIQLANNNQFACAM